MGNHDDSTTNRPIPILSDGDLVFMSQLSNDIVRSVGDISSVRQHSIRTTKRKRRLQAEDAQIASEHTKKPKDSKSKDMKSKDSKPKDSKSKDGKSGDSRSCQECGRVDTPEWRKGPKGPGTLCNLCGLLYEKRKRRLKKEKASLTDNSMLPTPPAI
jgi:uncharacterized protein (DUF39 family)